MISILDAFLILLRYFPMKGTRTICIIPDIYSISIRTWYRLRYTTNRILIGLQ